jgi:hypothetical protein
METFFQVGNQTAGLIETSPSTKENTYIPITIFGTESCIGCHSSAYLFDSYSLQKGKMTLGQGSQLSGDFSWLLKKAAWDKDVPKPTSKNN